MTSPQFTSSHPETDARISRAGVFAALAVAALGLGFSAPIVGPFTAPSEIDGIVLVGSWWVAAALVVWLALSLATWFAVLGRPDVDAASWLRFVTVPGSRKLAEGLMAVSVLAVAAGCAPGANQVTAPRIDVLRPAESAAAPITVPTAVSSVTTLVDTADLPEIELSGSGSSTTLAAIGSLADGEALVDTSTLGDAGTDAGPTWPPSEPADPFSPGGSELATGRGVGPTSIQTSPEASQHVIAEGEHFWSIAQAHVAASLGRPATDAEVTPYWAQVVKANEDSIQSGCANLVYPGEIIILPPVG